MERYGTKVLHLAYSFVRNRATAEDLAQEIFIKCYKQLDSFKGDSSLQTWLYRVAVNHCKDHVKSWHYRRVQASEYVSSLIKGQEHGPEEHFLQKAKRDALIEEVLRLPMKYREVIILAYFHELTMNEIGEVCGVNVNTVKSRASKAKELLRKSMAERSGWDGEEIEGSQRKNVQG
ncbi:RNA polymerase factor sigma C [Bacillus sp. FJAT-27225]|nr:RNA polymerase factor sigma C [Bacillus sp. FJAT-27225]